MVSELRGPALRLRAPRLGDVAQRLALGHVPDIIHMFGADPAALSPLTPDDAQAELDRLARDDHGWVIEHEGRFLGTIALRDHDPHDRRARLGIGLYDPQKLGHGLGRQAIRLVLAHGFSHLGLHRVSLRVVAYNLRAIRCYAACGFVEEGREREAALVGAVRHDDIMMGILAREFRNT